ncbi:Noc2p family-domain-containing protein [Rhodotorula diobovata]|uniref:Noc2p family-domain-containing protein n=1 Tax=Rhodotorula diobovata TaxID=5288 RepID=A0A5C5FXE7_9BASI|nr:Noc2p family-domain-containing protein [Rhodotorula diobovata]
MAKTGSKRKQTVAFLKSGALKGQIDARHKRKEFANKKKGRDAKRNKGVLPAHQQPKEDRSDDEFEEVRRRKAEAEEVDSDEEGSGDDMGVDDVLGAEGLDSDAGEGAADGAAEDDGSDLEDDDLSDLEDDEGQHMADIAALAQKDPDFFKYLQENDPELLDFAEQGDAAADEDEDEDMSDEEDEEEDSEDEASGNKAKKGKGKEKEKVKKSRDNVLTKDVLRSWQKNILETRSPRSLRKLLLAFRSAAQSGNNDDEGVDVRGAGERYRIVDPKVFEKVVTTALKYTPVVLQTYSPYKEVAGKYKLSTNSKQYATTQRLLKSYFVSLQALLASTSSASGIPSLAVAESAKLVPWVVGNRKVARGWVKLLLGLYDSASDEVRVQAFLALRKLAVAADHSLRESVIKGAYAALLGSSRQTSMYTLGAITLMKNSASELFLLPGKQEGELAYQLAFGYIRSLAILLRKGVKDASKEAFKSVYNWQFVHAVDFWSLVLSASCDKQRVAEQGESPLQPLLYPLIQVALGAIRLVPTSRYFPLRFHLVRALLRIMQRTGTYIPVATSLFEVLDSPELTKRTKPSTLKPLDWDYYLKCPTAYQRTRVYADALVDEVVFLLSELYGGALATSIAFPELALPAIVSLRRHAKKLAAPKLAQQVKQLVDKLEANSAWIEQRREQVEFAPGKRDKVDRFLADEDVAKTPMGTHAKLQRKLREQKKAIMERAMHAGEDI